VRVDHWRTWTLFGRLGLHNWRTRGRNVCGNARYPLEWDANFRGGHPARPSESRRSGSYSIRLVDETIEAVASEFGNLLTKVAPDKASVELGVEIAAEPGRLTAILVKGTAKANLTITLEWQKAGTAAK